eukprot:gnl/MRDRNA2_/MRDRNA2_78937_c0_seq1.p1 gnl/MRDRNA2_/MRDRNA2_78937_c0~~gnl/MRDRNA2_/MRDRNA2_78937_c0_seq1.p1  ORF type:complete len:474 (+),score=95.66 gnl/MRDRNA2_/MRDRNA2_78937_c0_seq1:138-1559(+)
MWHDARMIAAVAALGLSIQTKAWGLNVWQEALLFGIISSLSLPIGALMGQYFSPVQDYIVAAIVAFGAGALLFAVTVELYGHALHEVAHGSLGYTEMVTTVACALLGALLYLYLNKMMESWVEDEGEEGDEEEPASATGASSSSGAAGAAPKAAPKAGSRWDKLRKHASDVGEAAVKEKRKMMTAKEALNKFFGEGFKSKEHHAKMKAIRGRKKRMLLAAGAVHQHPTYGSIETGGKDEDEDAKKARVEEGMRLAYAMFLGLLVDGIPESILLGFLAAENSLSLVLVLSLFVANFPEAFSSASLMKEAEAPLYKIMGMWSFLCVLTGVLAALACAGLLYFAGDAAASGTMPFHVRMIIAVVEGIAGGAMIACIAAVMLPEAFGRKHETNMLMDPGFLCTAGFLCAVMIKVIGGVVTSDDIKHTAEGEKVPHITEEHYSISPFHSLGSHLEAEVNKTLSHLFAEAAHRIVSNVF